MTLKCELISIEYSTLRRCLIGPSDVNMCVDFVKMERNKMELETHCFAVSDVVSSVQSLFAVVSAEKSIPISFQVWCEVHGATDGLLGSDLCFVMVDIVCLQVDPAVPLYVMGDQLRTSQVLTNLVSNAIKFSDTPQGHERGVEVSAQCMPMRIRSNAC